MKRTPERTAAIAGILLGLAALTYYLYSSITTNYAALNPTRTITITILILIANILAITAAIKIKKKRKISGAMMMVAATIGFACIPQLYFLPAACLFMGGILAKSGQHGDKKTEHNWFVRNPLKTTILIMIIIAAAILLFKYLTPETLPVISPCTLEPKAGPCEA
ncbi:hypothetical protein ACFL3V_07230, partial [Nanoarchaeota archaeon]